MEFVSLSSATSYGGKLVNHTHLDDLPFQELKCNEIEKYFVYCIVHEWTDENIVQYKSCAQQCNSNTA